MQVPVAPQTSPTARERERAKRPLTPAFQQRIRAVKEKHRLTYGDIAGRAGIADSTLGNITRADNNVSTAIAKRLKGVIEEFEEAPVGSWKGAAHGFAASSVTSPSAATIDIAAIATVLHRGETRRDVGAMPPDRSVI
jgi:hypothetical protein